MAKFEIFLDDAGEYRWRLRTGSGQQVAVSGEGYKQKQSCRSAIELIKAYAPTAGIDDLTHGAPPPPPPRA